VTEYDATVSPAQTAVVSFDYDNRGRLTLDRGSRCQGQVWEKRVLDGTTDVYNAGTGLAINWGVKRQLEKVLLTAWGKGYGSCFRSRRDAPGV
jgi:hypothetical protein